MLSLIGLASTCTISWTGLGLGLATEIGAGGPGAVRDDDTFIILDERTC
jgi:choline transport protein